MLRGPYLVSVRRRRNISPPPNARGKQCNCTLFERLLGGAPQRGWGVDLQAPLMLGSYVEAMHKGVVDRRTSICKSHLREKHVSVGSCTVLCGACRAIALKGRGSAPRTGAAAAVWCWGGTRKPEAVREVTASHECIFISTLL